MSEAIAILKKQIAEESRRLADLTANARRAVQEALIAARDAAWEAIGYDSKYACLSSIESISMDEMTVVYTSHLSRVTVRQRIDCETPPTHSDTGINLFCIAVAYELNDRREHFEAYLLSKSRLDRLNGELVREKHERAQLEKKSSPQNFGDLLFAEPPSYPQVSHWGGMWSERRSDLLRRYPERVEREIMDELQVVMDSTPNSSANWSAPSRASQERLQRQLDSLIAGRASMAIVPASHEVQVFTERPHRLSESDMDTMRRVMASGTRRFGFIAD